MRRKARCYDRCMESAKRLNLPLLGGVVVVIVLGAALYLYFGVQSSYEVPQIDAGPDVGAQVSDAAETPADKLPETNPFTGYKNPFE